MSEEVSYNNIGYVSLHNHTTYSILDSLIKPIDLFKRTAELGQTAVAVTDHGSLAGMWDCLEAAKETGVKLIPGVEIYFVDDINNKEERMRHLILLSKNEIGYRNLLNIVSEGFDNNSILFKKVYPRVDWAILEKYKEGIICTTACANGILGQLINEKKYDKAFENAQRLKNIFGDDFAIELQAYALKRVNTSYSGEIDQISTNKRLREIAEKLDIKCIVSTNAHYVYAEQHEAHDVLLAVAAGQPVNSGSRLKYENAQLHIRSEEDIYNKLSRISYDKDFAKKCIENTKYFADKCEFPDWIDPKHSNPSGKELPEFPVKDQDDYSEFIKWNETNYINGKNEDEMYLRYRCYIGLISKVPESDIPKYQERLDIEFEVIEKHGFSSYMLIVMDYLEFARKNNILIGVGRGSVGGVLIAYLTDIHIVDPIKYNLIFERFHNKEKTSMPDIDADFASEGKEIVQNYISKKYGEDYVAHVSNINTMTPKVYARAIARAFIYGGDRKAAVSVGTTLADTIPDDIKTVSGAIEGAALFSEYTKPLSEGGGGYTELAKYAKDIGGQYVAWATHAAGIVIGKRPLKGLVPIRKDKENIVALEYEKERAEKNGLVKMDILGLSTLDVISDTRDLIKSLGKELPKNLLEYDYNQYDKKTYDLISSGNTFCVFQLGKSSGTINLCREVKPKNIEDIAIINSLARPSARDIRESFVKTRNGEIPVNIIHPSMNRAFGSTLGFGLFEESLFFLAQDVAGWQLNDADRLRKLTKMKGKDQSKVKKWREEFIEGAEKTGVGKEIGTKIWDEVIALFGGYGFNKSHAVFYSLIGFYTAYLKAHYPLEFLVANLKSEVASNTKISKDNIAKIKEEIRAMKINIVPPDINTSDITYKIIDENTLMTGFDAIKFMGKDAMPEILAKRPFKSFEDFITRVDASKVKAPAIQALAASGCLDSFGIPRKSMYLYSADYKKKLAAFNKKKEKNPEKWKDFSYPWPEENEWSIAEKCALERFYIGEYLSGDKVDAFNGFFQKGGIPYKHFIKLLPPPSNLTDKELKKYTKKVNLVQGEVKSVFEFKVKKEDSKIRGEVMAKICLEDPYGNQINMTCFPEGWDELKTKVSSLSKGKFKFEPGCGIYINANLGWYEDQLSLTFEELLKFSPPPQVPSDLKPKKVDMKSKKDEEVVVVFDEDDRNVFLQDVEEELVDMGNSDLHDEFDD